MTIVNCCIDCIKDALFSSPSPAFMVSVGRYVFRTLTDEEYSICNKSYAWIDYRRSTQTIASKGNPGQLFTHPSMCTNKKVKETFFDPWSFISSVKVQIKGGIIYCVDSLASIVKAMCGYVFIKFCIISMGVFKISVPVLVPMVEFQNTSKFLQNVVKILAKMLL